MAVFVGFLGLLSILACTPSTTADPIEVIDFNLEKSDTSDVEVTFAEAKKLCQNIHESRLHTDHVYLWVSVKSAGQQPEDVQFTPGCFTAKYITCKGDSRFPIPESCGFFTLVPDSKCPSSTGNERSGFSTSAQQKISLSHGRAVQLCASIENLPEDISFQINYVPIKVSLTVPQKEHTSESCVRWTKEPCVENEQQPTNCDWSIKVSSAKHCEYYSNFFNRFNTSQLARLPNPMTHKTDYIVDENVKEEVINGVQNLLSDSIQCTREGLVVNCQIAKGTKGDRSKRAVTSARTPVARVKRQCCSLHRCGHCGRRSFFGVRDLDCDCSNTIGGDCHPLCDMHEYSAGCYGDCFVG